MLKPALDPELSVDQLAAIDQIVPFGRAVVPYYLDDSWANFEPSQHHW